MRIGDGYGEMLLAALEDKDEVLEIVERDDGLIMASRFGPEAYFAPYRRWPSRQRRALRLARGRVLDVGAGAGRLSLHLQEKDHDVVAIDASPGAVEVCRRRGVRDARLLRVEEVDEQLGVFDTIVMYGNNLGLLASRRRGRGLLRRLHRVTSPQARILGEMTDVYTTEDPVHLAYHERNRRRGRMSGQLRIRIRYRDAATPWFDYLFLSREELEELLEGTGWRLARTYEDDGRFYVAVIEKEAPARAARTGSRARPSSATSRPSGRRRARSGRASSRA
jgi:SAM-dependent methyltransferase